MHSGKRSFILIFGFLDFWILDWGIDGMERVYGMGLVSGDY